MAKRPTLSIPRKAKHKGLNNPISGLKPARSSLDYDQNLFTAPVKPKVRELQRKSSSFWEEDEDGVGYVERTMGQPSESIHSDEYIAQATTPEQILASRINAAGPDVAAAFMRQAEKAKALASVDPSRFATSTDPAEKLQYMASQGSVSLQKVAAAMRHRDKQWGTPQAEGEHEDDFSTRMSEAQKAPLSKSIKDPVQRALSVVGAMTISDQSWKQQVDAPDLITPDSHGKWVDPLQKAAQAYGTIASAYIDPDKLEGGEFGPAYASLHSRITKMLSRQIPQRIANTGFEQATRGPGSKPVGWTQALPSVDSIRKSLPVSDRMFLTNKLDKLWTEKNGKFESPFTDAIKTIREVYQSGEGGLSKAKNFEYRENRYLMDEIAASGLVDPTQSVKSQNPGRDEMYDFKVTTDVGDLVESAMQAMGAVPADLVGDPGLRNQIKRAAAEIAATGEAQSANQAISLTPKANVLNINGISEAPAKAAPEPYITRERGRGGQATITKKNRVVKQNISPGDVIQTAAEAKAEDKMLTGDPAAARVKYFAERPWLKAIADDDDKSDPMSAWQRHRRGKVTSSAAGALADPESQSKAMHNLLKGALTPINDPVTIQRGSIWTKSGDALEPVALDWYRKNVDPNAFEPGLIFNRNKEGQATTPDAIADGGRRNVEIKSRNKFIDPANPLDQNEAKTLRKNYLQMQHQMYLTGASSTDLIEIIRDPENPNAPLGKNGLNDNNIRKRRVDRDDELIRQMRPQWEQAGKAAAQISSLDSRTQKMFAKAVEEGNIQSFEKLSKRHGVTGGAALAATLGMTEGGSGGDGKPPKSTGYKGNFGGFGGRDSPTTFRGGVRGGLAAMGAPGRAINVALAGAEILWNTTNELNDSGLELSQQARAAGMREGLFRKARLSMTQGRYLDEQSAMSDISSVSLAKGGLELGFTDRAVNLVTSTRGAITLGDIHNTNLNDPDAVRALMEQTERRLRDRGVSEYGIAATMEQSGLKSLLSATDAEGGRMQLNEAVTSINDNILELKLTAGDYLGQVAGFGEQYFQSMTDSLNQLVNSMGSPGSAAGAFKRPPMSTTRDGVIGPAIEKLYDDVTGFQLPTRASELADEISLFIGMNGTLPEANREALEKQFRGISAAERNRVMDAIRDDSLPSNELARDVRAGGRLEVELKADGIQITAKDNNGRITSKAFKPYNNAEE